MVPWWWIPVCLMLGATVATLILGIFVSNKCGGCER